MTKYIDVILDENGKEVSKVTPTNLKELENTEDIELLLNSILEERDYTSIDLSMNMNALERYKQKISVGDIFKFLPLKFQFGNNLYQPKLYVYTIPGEESYYLLRFERNINKNETDIEKEVLQPSEPFLFYEIFLEEVLRTILEEILLPYNAIEINNETGKFDGNMGIVEKLEKLKNL